MLYLFSMPSFSTEFIHVPFLLRHKRTPSEHKQTRRPTDRQAGKHTVRQTETDANAAKKQRNKHTSRTIQLHTERFSSSMKLFAMIVVLLVGYGHGRRRKVCCNLAHAMLVCSRCMHKVVFCFRTMFGLFVCLLVFMAAMLTQSGPLPN